MQEIIIVLHCTQLSSNVRTENCEMFCLQKDQTLCVFSRIKGKTDIYPLPMVLLFIVSATCSMKTSNGKPRNKQLITFLRRVIKSHTPLSLQLTVNCCLSIICVCCLPSGLAAAASGIKSTDLLLKCLCSSNVYFHLKMVLKDKAVLTKKRWKVFPFNEKHSKTC